MHNNKKSNWYQNLNMFDHENNLFSYFLNLQIKNAWLVIKNKQYSSILKLIEHFSLTEVKIDFQKAKSDFFYY